MVRIKKNLHDREERQAGVRLFARSISVRRTSEARFMYSPEPDLVLYGEMKIKICQLARENSK